MMLGLALGATAGLIASKFLPNVKGKGKSLLNNITGKERFKEANLQRTRSTASQFNIH